MKTALTLTVATALSALAFSPGCGDAGRTATWAYISPIILQPNCATGSCHSPAAAADGLDFSTPARGYTSLTGLWVWVDDPTQSGQPGCGKAADTTVCEKQYRPLVTPYDPAQSRLVSVLRGRDAPRMPPDRPLDEADIELIETWILDGALETQPRVFAKRPIIDGSVALPHDGGTESVARGDGGTESATRGDAATTATGDAHGAEASGG